MHIWIFFCNFAAIFAITTNNQIFISMKKELLLLLFMSSLLVGCHSDLKFDDIDPAAQMNMGVALKVGTITAKLGDFVDKSEDLFIYRDSTFNGDPKMVIAWRHMYPDTRDYHPIRQNMFLAYQEFSLKAYDEMKRRGLIDNQGKITGNGQPITLDFEMPIIFGVNHDVNDERVDSALFDLAQFQSTVTMGNSPIQWSWVKRVTLDFGDQGRSPQGKIITVYNGGQSACTDALNEVQNLSLCLMNNRNLDPATDQALYPTNVRPDWKLIAHITFTIPNRTTVTFDSDDIFRYSLGLDMKKWTALWGYFKPSPDMETRRKQDMDEYLHDYPWAKRAKLPATDPKVEVEVSSFIAGRMRLSSEYAYIHDANGDSISALFNGQPTRPPHYMSDDEMMKIDASTIGDSAKTYLLFDNTDERGDIDRLLKNMPTWLFYHFNLDFDMNSTPQIRLTPNTMVTVNTTCTLPLMFDHDMFIDYADTITDLNLTEANIDSLVNEEDWIDTLQVGNVTVYLTARNYIPLTLKAKLRFLDANYQPVKDPVDPTKDFYPFVEDTMRIAPPRYIKVGNNVVPDPNTPGKTIITAKMTKQQVKALKEVKNIEYKVFADNDALKYAYEMGLDKARLEEESRLYIDVGVTAQIEAVLNFENNNK